MKLNLKQLEEKVQELTPWSKNYGDENCFVYEGQIQHLEELSYDLIGEDENKTISWDPCDTTDLMEDLLEDHIREIYDDWVMGEENLYCDNDGNWNKGTSGYQWMLWSLETQIYDVVSRLVEWGRKNDQPLPKHYHENWGD